MARFPVARNQGGQLFLDVIEELYACLVDPERYVGLIGSLAALTDAAAAGRIDWEGHVRPVLQRHVATVEALIDSGASPALSRSDAVSADPNRPRALVAPDGRILAANDPLIAAFGGARPEGIDDLELDADGSARLRALLARLSNGNGKARPLPALAGALRLYPAGMRVPLLMVASPLRDPEAGACLVLQAAGFAPSDRMLGVLGESFGLTGAELRVTALLLAGHGVEAIARARGSRLDTVRTQIKAILRKTDTHERSQFMRLAAALAPFDAPHWPSALPAGLAPDGHVAISGGRRLAWRMFGARQGRPVLFVHGMLDGWSLPGFWERRLTEAGLTLIVPARPGFGTSDPTPAGADPLQEAIGWSRALLDHLGIGCCSLVAQGSGTPVGWAIASAHGARISALVMIAGLVPGLTGRARPDLPDWGAAQSALARCAAHSPETAQILLRLCVALLARGGHRAFARTLYEASPQDRAVCADPELFAHVARGYDIMRAQGHAAMAGDAALVARDWSALPAQAAQQAVLLHGDADTATPPAAVADFAARRPGTVLRLLAGAGQLLGYRRPDALITALVDPAGPIRSPAGNPSPDRPVAAP